MLCETSHVGACVRLEAIPRNPKVNLGRLVKILSWCSICLTAPVENAASCK